MKTTLSLTLLLTALPLGLPAQPLQHGPHPHERLTDRLLEDPEVIEAANLEDDQVQALRDLFHDFQVFQIENRAGRELTRLEIERLWQSDEPDADAIHDAIDEQGEHQAALRHQIADLRFGVREVLTPEQRESIEETLRKRSQERGANARNAPRSRRGHAGDSFAPPGERPARAPRAPLPTQTRWRDSGVGPESPPPPQRETELGS